MAPRFGSMTRRSAPFPVPSSRSTAARSNASPSFALPQRTRVRKYSSISKAVRERRWFRRHRSPDRMVLAAEQTNDMTVVSIQDFEKDPHALLERVEGGEALILT